MPTGEAWETFGKLGAVIVFLGAVWLGLKQLGIVRPRARPAPAEAAPESKPTDAELARRVAELERDLAALKLHLAENYISRTDWVPMTSKVIGILEEHGAMLARLDERTRQGERT